MISIDPGVHGCGWAFWEYDQNSTGAVPVLRSVGYSEDFKAAFMDGQVIIEVPQVYMGSKSKGNPNDLIRVAFAAGRATGSNEFVSITPRKWKGTIKKEAMLKRILGRLDDRELALLKGLKLPPSKEHNVTDAVGIGLWRLGRL